MLKLHLLILVGLELASRAGLLLLLALLLFKRAIYLELASVDELVGVAVGLLVHLLRYDLLQNVVISECSPTINQPITYGMRCLVCIARRVKQVRVEVLLIHFLGLDSLIWQLGTAKVVLVSFTSLLIPTALPGRILP